MVMVHPVLIVLDSEKVKIDVTSNRQLLLVVSVISSYHHALDNLSLLMFGDFSGMTQCWDQLNKLFPSGPSPHIVNLYVPSCL